VGQSFVNGRYLWLEKTSDSIIPPPDIDSNLSCELLLTVASPSV